MPAAVRPWGLTRMVTGEIPTALWPTSMSVDPETQVGRYYGSDGSLLPLMCSTRIGKHATRDVAQTPYTTNRDGFEEVDGHRADTSSD